MVTKLLCLDEVKTAGIDGTDKMPMVKEPFNSCLATVERTKDQALRTITSYHLKSILNSLERFKT